METNQDNKIQVVTMMTHPFDRDDFRPWRRSRPMARVAILEGKVYLNNRLVTHTEVSVPRGNYNIKVWNTYNGEFETLDYFGTTRV